MPDTLKDLLTRYLGAGWAPGVQQTGVRPDYGLSTATGINPAARSVYERTLAPGEKRSAESLRDMLAEVIMAAGSVAVPGTAPRGQARQAPGGRSILRPKNWQATSDEGASVLQSLKRPGHVYRGIEEAEYNATLGSGRGIRSTGKFSHKSEGTNFASNPADAESYVNFGRSDPRKTGRDTFIVETVQTPEMVVGRDGYVKSQSEVPATRVWRIRASDGALILEDM